jgi:hypothetical protein
MVKNKEKEKEIIEQIILDFYMMATTDILLGYQFRKIEEYEQDEFKHHPLRPPIEAFSHHLPIINEFWIRQLKGETKDSTIQLDLINKHIYLNMKKGELKRFQLLFKEILDLHKKELQEIDLYQEWHSKIDHFTSVFLRSRIFNS